MNETITITFGDQAENHVGMQMIGKSSENGFSLLDLQCMESWAKDRNLDTELIHMNKYLDIETTTDAHLLILRKGIQSLISPLYDINDFIKEQNN